MYYHYYLLLLLLSLPLDNTWAGAHGARRANNDNNNYNIIARLRR